MTRRRLACLFAALVPVAGLSVVAAVTRPSPVPAPAAAGAAAAATRPTSRPAVDPAKLLGNWVTTTTVGDRERVVRYTIKDGGRFEEHDSNWGRNWGQWRLDGDTVHLRWTVRGGFNGTWKVQSLTDDELVVEFAGGVYRYTRTDEPAWRPPVPRSDVTE